MAAEKKEYALVVKGRSVLTVLGTAHAGAKITPKMLSNSGKENAGVAAFRKLLNDNVIKYPPTKKEVIEKDSGGQLSFGGKTEKEEGSKEEESKKETSKEETPKEETPKEETSKEETPKEETPKEETPKEEASKAGAKRKKR